MERLAGVLVVVGLLSVLGGCGRAEPVEVSTSPAASPSSATGPASSFQGAVAAVDPHAGEIAVAVQIIWTPVLKADPHERRVLVDGNTRWEPVPTSIEAIQVGDELQIQAESASDGRWRATEIMLLDID